MVIDFHTHIFPDKIAGATINALSTNASIPPHNDGTLSGLLSQMAESGVDISVNLPVLTKAKQFDSILNFGLELNQKAYTGPRVIAFAGMHPDITDYEGALQRVKELGFLGIKLHPDYQGFFVDDPKMKPIYKKISSLGLITVFHAGKDYGFAPPYCATPERLARALSWFQSPVVAAHWGGINCNEGVLEHLCGRDIYFDTSFGYSMMPRYYALKIIEKHTADKMLFGTDTPWHTPEMELRLLNNLGLSEADMVKITSGNAKKLLGI